MSIRKDMEELGLALPKCEGKVTKCRAKVHIPQLCPLCPIPRRGLGRAKCGGRRRLNSRTKGAVGEREFAEQLRAWGWSGAKRGQQRSGLEQADVVDGPPGVHWEVKRVQALNVGKAFAQARRDAEPYQTPVVAHRRNNEPWLVTLSLEALLALLPQPGALRDSGATGSSRGR